MNNFLQGNYAPVTHENYFENITSIIGEVPKELSGALYRNGPNPQFPDNSKHWFEGDGMLHAFYIQNGQVSYRNRWIETERFKHERLAGKALFKSFSAPLNSELSLQDISHNTANTNIIRHANKLLALEEGSAPTEINPCDLSVIGEWNYQRCVPKMSAHPHFDPRTNEMHCHAYTPGTNEIFYYVINNNGIVIKTEKIAAPFSSFMHDFIITEDYAIFPILPLTFNFDRVREGKPLLMWEPEKGAFFGILKRDGAAKEIQWLRTEPFYAFHFMNAYQANGHIILDGMKAKQAHLFPDANGIIPGPTEFPPYLTQWSLDLKQNKVRETLLDNVPAEFPRFDERFTGLHYRYGFVVAAVDTNAKILDFDSIICYDIKNKNKIIREFGKGNTPSEPVFVPNKKGTQEGDGFLLSVVYNAENHKSSLYILDAMNIDKEPLAIVNLPLRVPNGFHGNWYDMG